MSQESIESGAQIVGTVVNATQRRLHSIFSSEGYLREDMTEDAYKQNLQKKEELVRQKKKHHFYIITFCFCFFTLLIVLLQDYIEYYAQASSNKLPFLTYLHAYPDFPILYTAIFAVFFVFLSTTYSLKQHNKISKLEGYIYAYERFQLRNNIDEDIYESSIQMSYKYLDQYYKETREQASRGFLITVGIAIIGAVIIAIGITSMFINATQSSYVTTASGVIIEFISSIFFTLYNKTIQSMGNYHNKLILSQNVAIALKVSESIEGPDKDKVKVDMIKALTTDINQHINSNKPVE